MADHQQDVILQALRAALLAANTAAGDRVRIEGVDPVPADSMPMIEIEAGQEAVRALTVSYPARQERDFDIEVRVLAAQNDDYRATAGRLLAQVEAALNPPGTGAGPVGVLPPGRLRLLGSTPDRDGNASRVVYTIRSLWRVKYFTTEGRPAVAAR